MNDGEVRELYLGVALELRWGRKVSAQIKPSMGGS